ncbi:MAG: hypothetical protein H6741_08910 [Alphaproteobacteria bacterium]|nr:hypothetical protein [Alphaproteobacteria bacterium]MCB9792833.1 hypothetical protein [Alphaproteobacteria bacterium]
MQDATRDPRPGVLLLLAFLVGLPGLAGDFVWDDKLLVLQNSATASLSNAASWFTHELWAGTPVAEDSAGYYRPLFLLDLALDRALGGLSPGLHRAHSLLWHLLAGGLLWRLLRRVGFEAVAAATGMALFLLHPAQVEATQFVAARNDPMAAAWCMGALLLLTRAPLSPLRLLGGAACALGAALCKESALLLPGLYAFVELARVGPQEAPGQARVGGYALGAWAGHGALLLGLGAYWALRTAAGVGWPAAFEPGALLPRLPYLLGHYADTLLWPVNLAPGASLTWPAATPWGALLIAGLWGVTAPLLLGRRALAGLGFAALAFAPALAGVARTGVLADRYLYLPMVGLALLVAAAAQRGSPRGAGALLLTVLLGVNSLRAMPTWLNDLTLWHVAAERRDTPYAWGALAKALQREGKLDAAAHANRQALDADPPFPHACFNATRLHLDRGEPGAAVENGRFALARGCEPSPELLAPLAVAEASVGQWEEAEVTASRVGQDPTGLAVIVRVAAAARHGELGPFTEAVGQGDPAALAGQVRWLLEQSGEAEAAEALMGQLGAGP